MLYSSIAIGELIQLRIRRIKCDEGKPSCKRCSSTGRKCDGYAVIQVEEPEPALSLLTESDNSASPVSTTSSDVERKLISYVNHASLYMPGHLMEARALDYFQLHTACEFAGWFDIPFWTWQLPHVGNVEPIIRHAIIAVASVHEQMEVISDTSAAWDPSQLEYRRRFALYHYNKAISELTKLAFSGHDSTKITLVCCLLFICLEFIRGNFSTAEMHINSGLQILSRWTRERTFRENLENQSLDENLAQTFYRLGIQSSLCEKPLSIFYPDISISKTINLHEDTRAFPDLITARVALDSILKETIRLLRLGAEVTLEPLSSLARLLFEEDVAVYMAESTVWYQNFENLCSQMSKTMTFAEKQGAGDLHVWYLTARTWIESSHTPFETEFDAHLEKFQKIIELGEQLFYKEGSPYQTPVASFTFEKGILPPVFFVAMRCRHRILRRRAILLLKKASPRRVGMWNAELLAACAERIIQIEEEGMGPVSEAEDEWPAEEKRIHGSDGIASQDYWVPPEVAMTSVVKGRTEYSRKGTRVQSVKYMMRPDGVEGKWKIRDEVIKW